MHITLRKGQKASLQYRSQPESDDLTENEEEISTVSSPPVLLNMNIDRNEINNQKVLPINTTTKKQTKILISNRKIARLQEVRILVCYQKILATKKTDKINIKVYLRLFKLR